MESNWLNTVEIKPFIVRSSGVHRICTNRPTFDENNYRKVEQDFIATLEKKKLIYEPDQIELYCTTDGIKTKAQALKNEIMKKVIFEEDPLPEGAKTAIQEIWLENNYGFYSVALKSDAPQLLKGQVVEKDAIDFLGTLINIPIEKNEQRINLDSLTGECDVKYIDPITQRRVIRDVKCPEDWASFRKKLGVETTYYWQLIAYCYLYGAVEAHLDYILMPTPSYILDKKIEFLSDIDKEKMRSSNAQVESLPQEFRWKTFEITGIQSSIEFLKSRLQKAEDYYNSLTYEECMNLVA